MRQYARSIRPGAPRDNIVVLTVRGTNHLDALFARSKRSGREKCFSQSKLFIFSIAQL
jgi:hypothetical protein